MLTVKGRTRIATLIEEAPSAAAIMGSATSIQSGRALAHTEHVGSNLMRQYQSCGQNSSGVPIVPVAMD